MRSLAAGIAVCVPSVLYAHDGAHGPHDIGASWTLEPLVIALLILCAVAYTLGRARRAARRKPVTQWRALSFWSGWGALVVALVSPVDALGELLFAGHMIQHLLLTMVAAPLLVLADGGTAMLWSLPFGGRRGLGRVLRASPVRAGWRALSHPVVAWALHGAALTLWHLPGPYELAIENNAVHALEHWSFLVTALLFWWRVLSPIARHRLRFGYALLYLFSAATLSGLLGALIALSAVPWYGVHAPWTSAWGLTPLEDQQLAGLIMWIPAAMIYLAAVIPMSLRVLSDPPLAVRAS